MKLITLSLISLLTLLNISLNIGCDRCHREDINNINQDSSTNQVMQNEEYFVIPILRDFFAKNNLVSEQLISESNLIKLTSFVEYKFIVDVNDSKSSTTMHNLCEFIKSQLAIKYDKIKASKYNFNGGTIRIMITDPRPDMIGKILIYLIPRDENTKHLLLIAYND